MSNLFFAAHSAPRTSFVSDHVADELDVFGDLELYQEFADSCGHDPDLAERAAHVAVQDQRRLLSTYGIATVWEDLQPEIEVDISDFSVEEYLQFIEHFVLDCSEDDIDGHIFVAHGAVLIDRAEAGAGRPADDDVIMAAVKSAVLAGVPKGPSVFDHPGMFRDPETTLPYVNSVPLLGTFGGEPVDADFPEPSVGEGFVEADITQQHAMFDEPLNPFPQNVSDQERVVYEYRDPDLEIYTIVVDQPQTMTVGEEGEHIYGLKNGATLIVPPHFVDYNIYWGVPA